jgi:transposase
MERRKNKKYPCKNTKRRNKDTSVSKYNVRLNQGQRKELERVVKSGIAPALKILRAQMLLKVDQGAYGPHWSHQQIREVFAVSETFITKIKKRFLQEGLQAAINRKKQPERPEKRTIDGKQEAQIIAILCTEQPEGQERWTLRTLQERTVELEIVESVSHETIRTVLKKNVLKPWQKKNWCVGPTDDEFFVAAMEDVLDVYSLPYDPARPVVCVDEGSVQLVSEKREALPMEPGKVAREDYEYTREGYCNAFLATEPLTGTCVVQAKGRRTKQDFAQFLRDVLEQHYPDAEKVVLVMDNLNTHTTASFYRTFPAEEARRLSQRLEIHYTPKHGSWLNMAEIELSVLARQALSGRIGSFDEFETRLHAWQRRHNARARAINWRFTTADARIRLKRLYPRIEV